MSKVVYTGVEPLVLETTGIQTNSFLPKTGVAYKRGDLLTLTGDTTDAGILTHGTEAKWEVICLDDVSAEQATKHAADKVGIPVYTHLGANLNAVMLNGVLLTEEQKAKARAHSAVNTSITLRLPYAGKGV